MAGLPEAVSHSVSLKAGKADRVTAPGLMGGVCRLDTSTKLVIQEADCGCWRMRRATGGFGGRSTAECLEAAKTVGKNSKRLGAPIQ